jgi:hypothetical protein
MKIQELENGLAALGFKTGYAAKDAEGDSSAEIVLWENEEPQPTEEEILAASPAGALARKQALVEDQRRAAYQTESDPLFFGWQRGDNTEQEWLDAVQAVKDAYPYPEVTE